MNQIFSKLLVFSMNLNVILVGASHASQIVTPQKQRSSSFPLVALKRIHLKTKENPSALKHRTVGLCLSLERGGGVGGGVGFLNTPKNHS